MGLTKVMEVAVVMEVIEVIMVVKVIELMMVREVMVVVAVGSLQLRRFGGLSSPGCQLVHRSTCCSASLGRADPGTNHLVPEHGRGITVSWTFNFPGVVNLGMLIHELR